MTARILVVEDNGEKLRRVFQALLKVDGANFEMIDEVRDILSARRALHERFYDLLVLDISVPVRADEVPSPNAGVAFLDELNEREGFYHVPQHIVGLTAHEDVLAVANPRFSEDLWSVIQYDEASTAWEERLQRRLSHIIKTSASGVPVVDKTLNQKRKTETSDLIAAGESASVEFKSTLRWNTKAGRDDLAIELAALKTIAAFLNTKGGTLLIGVNDAGQVLGVAADHFQNHDKAMLHLTSLIRDRISGAHMRFVDISIDAVESGIEVMRIDCRKAEMPAYVRTDKGESFYIRTGPATTDLPVSEVHTYITTWF